MQTSGFQDSFFEEKLPTAVATMSPFKAGPTFKSMVSWFCPPGERGACCPAPLKNHASVFLKFLEFLEGTPIPPRLLARTFIHDLGLLGPGYAIIVYF